MITRTRAALKSRQRGFLLNPYRFGPPAGGDPNFASVSLLCHFNGPDGSTTFVDNSPSPKTLTAFGNAQIDTAQSVFGGASGLFDGAGDYVGVPDSSAFTFGTGDFTVEAWVRLNALAGAEGAYIIGQINGVFTQSTGSFFLALNDASRPAGLMATGASLVVATGTTVLNTGQWYHLAYTRSGSTFRIFVDGIEEGSQTSAAAMNDSGEAISIGRPGAYDGAYFNGWIDDLRVTKGVARYTADFAPPSAQFPDF